jgi:hypothetical protein
VSTSKLAYWFSHPKILEEIVKGTEYAEVLSKANPELRQDMIATLNQISRSLRWMPDGDDVRKISIKEFCEEGEGHLFLTSTRLTKAALRPIQTLILNLCLLMVKKESPIMFVLDEIGEFDKCPQVEQSISMNRFWGAPMILSFQNWTQLESKYGPLAESISTGCYTNVVFRTNSGKSAKHASAILGLEADIDRPRESRSQMGAFFSHPHRNWREELSQRSPVSPGEIQTLPPFEAYMAQDGGIVRISLPEAHPEENQPAFVERDMNTKGRNAFLSDMQQAAHDDYVARVRFEAKLAGLRVVEDRDDEEPAVAAMPRSPYKNSYTK